jgi:TPR repeat protein
MMQHGAGAKRRWYYVADKGGSDSEFDEANLLQATLEAQKLAIRELERSQSLQVELLQTKAIVAELKSELRSKELQLHSTLFIKEELLKAKDEILKARDVEIFHLRNDRARCGLAAPIDAVAAAAAAAAYDYDDSSYDYDFDDDFVDDDPIHVSFSAAGQADRLFRLGQLMYGDQEFGCSANNWIKAARLKHGESHACLADMLIEGRNCVAKNEAKAFSLAAAGAALGCPHSKGVLGRCYAYGRGVAVDVSKAIALAKESAAANSRFGQYVLGACYRDGKGVEQNDSKAVQWLRFATEQHHGAAQCKLGYMYEHGQGVMQDFKQAADLYESAAFQGIALAQYNYGACLENGRGVAQDNPESVRYYRLAAEQGEKRAIDWLMRVSNV